VLITLVALFMRTTAEKPMGKMYLDMKAPAAMHFNVHYGVYEQ